MWVVTETRSAKKSLEKLPQGVRQIYRVLVSDLEREGPMPYGWVAKLLKGREEVSVRLNREYRVLLIICRPNIVVVKVAHRKDAYQ